MTAGKSDVKSRYSDNINGIDRPPSPTSKRIASATLRTMEVDAIRLGAEGPITLQIPTDGGCSEVVVSKRTIINDTEKIKGIAALCESCVCRMMSSSFVSNGYLVI